MTSLTTGAEHTSSEAMRAGSDCARAGWPPRRCGRKKHGQTSMDMCTIGGASVNASLADRLRIDGFDEKSCIPVSAVENVSDDEALWTGCSAPPALAMP